MSLMFVRAGESPSWRHRRDAGGMSVVSQPPAFDARSLERSVERRLTWTGLFHLRENWSHVTEFHQSW